MFGKYCESEVSMPVAEDKAISIADAARRLGVHPNTVRRAIDQGKIRAFKFLGQIRIRESEIERIMEQGTDRLDDEGEHS
jgi:excisionase family DNA binding protein